MKDNKKIETEKKIIKSMIDFINGEDIKKLINGNYITITKLLKNLILWKKLQKN